MKKEMEIGRVAHAEITTVWSFAANFLTCYRVWGFLARDCQPYCSINTVRRRCPSLRSVQEGLLTKVAHFWRYGGSWYSYEIEK